VNNYENYAKKGQAVPFSRPAKKSGCCSIFFTKEIEYDCHLLGNPELLKNLSTVTGFSFSKVIDYSIKLEEVGYDLIDLDVDTIGSLMISME